MRKSGLLKSRISLIYISLVLIIVVLGAVSILSLYKINGAVASLITTNYNSIERIAQMEACLKEQRQNILLYIYDDKNQRHYTAFQDNYFAFIDSYNEEYKTIIIKDEMKMIVNIMSAYSDFNEAFSKLMDEGSEFSFAEGLEYYDKVITPKYISVLDSLNNLRVSNVTVLFERRDEARDIVQTATYFLYVIFFFAAVISFTTFRFYINKLFGPIYEITQNLKSVSQGNMNKAAMIRADDELGVLCNEFNNMTQRLSEFEKSTLGSLMEERNKTYSIVRSITEPMLILGYDFRVSLMNSSFETLINTTLEESYEKHFLELMNESIFKDAANKIDYKTRKYYEKIVKVHDRWRARYFKIMISPVFNLSEAEKSFVIIFFNDVTEMKRLDQMRTDFIATISHEFKTPLTSIIMGTDLMLSQAIGKMNEEQKEIVETIKEDGQQLNVLVNDLLDLSKVESSDIIYQFKQVSINDAINTCLKQFKPRAKSKNIVLKGNADNILPLVKADFSKIVWVLNNLISNAIKYTSEGDVIEIEASLKNNEEIIVCVKDNGMGIPEEFLEKIFDKYVQVRGCDIETRGTGLGLAVAKDIIEAHKGRIWCESNLSVGSRFYFTIPITT